MTGDVATRGKRPKLHTYYDCRRRGAERGPSCVRASADDIHAAVETLLGRLRVSRGTPATRLFPRGEPSSGRRATSTRGMRRHSDLRAEIDGTVAALVKATSPAAVAELDARVARLVERRDVIADRAAALGADLAQREDGIDALVTFVAAQVADLRRTWQSAAPAARAALARLTFPAGLHVTRQADGALKFRTPRDRPNFQAFSDDCRV